MFEFLVSEWKERRYKQSCTLTEEKKVHSTSNSAIPGFWRKSKNSTWVNWLISVIVSLVSVAFKPYQY